MSVRVVINSILNFFCGDAPHDVTCSGQHLVQAKSLKITSKGVCT